MLYFIILPFSGGSGSNTFKTTIVSGRGNVTKAGVLSERMTATYFYRHVRFFNNLYYELQSFHEMEDRLIGKKIIVT